MAKQNNTSSQISTQSVEEQDIPEVQNELSKVATNPKQSILILLVISAVFIFIFFKLFIADNKPPEVVTPSAPTDITKPTQDNSKNLPEIPKLPKAPKLETPVELPPPPPPPPPKVADVPKLPLPTTSVDNNSADNASLPSVVSSPLPGGIAESDEEKKRREAKRKSSIVLIAGVPEKKTPSQIAEEANFQDRGDMAFVLGRGKIIEAVLETAINSDLGGEVRAIISRDVFSEREKIILVPKGSRILGAYTTGINGAYGRIAIIWNRIDLSNGYTITLDAIAVDNLGRKGEQGRVDNKYKERLTNAVLLSVFNIGLANALDKVVAPPVNSQAAAANAAVAANIQSLAQSINNGPGTEDVKISQICSSVMNAIPDKTSAAYISMMQACNTAQNPTGSQPGQRIVALMTAVTNAAASLLTSTATASTPTQAQTASKQAFTDISDTMKGMIQQHEFKPTITIDQGTVIKIYVNKDYKFPQSVLRKSRLIK
ncbi:MAG: TrbI/VirB10 family protein [Rickettsia endosymbiont of Sergentomyia squamirostris]|uniref:TrbI/VirB10 family protein n=1 Tax=Candidatus Tisiphia endosymbiont of Sergentomyia squamirostris TaxID=3113639 RepID=A0AAT9G736_9RICK